MTITAHSIDSIRHLPKASRPADAANCIATLRVDMTAAPLVEANVGLIEATAGNAPYLARLLTRQPHIFVDYLTHGPEAALSMHPLTPGITTEMSQPELMQHLRRAKARTALVTALADVSGSWPLAEVTRQLSGFAGDCVRATLRYLLLMAMRRGELALPDSSEPEQGCGIIILGMGKLGAFELNYSSDIDLIVLFDIERLPYRGARNAQIFMNKLATDLVTLLQERTPDGYVFRTDLRLRPDPMSTPLAVTTAAALTYYETVGQNWERAAMIKARPLAGDMEVADEYMRELVPFIWRKTLDFATIADIYSIKRQMNVRAGKDDWKLPGHNVKTGLGGIREIEFFVATQQLVWGGRIPELRVQGTLAALVQLTEHEFVTADVCTKLTQHYEYLRTVEHRLQMRNDEQTHSMPEDAEALHEVSMFCGHDSTQAFAKECLGTLRHVHKIYTDSMRDSEPLAVDGNLVFTGVEADTGTLQTLSRMGYTETQRISDIIQGWHRGHRRSTRSKRSRQVLTELIPSLLTALGKTANPDTAFFHFDDFLERLPSGAQIFSLFNSRPEMLTLLADILGSAPALGDTLSNDPALFDAVLEPDFFLGLPDKEELENIVTERLRYASSYEQKMVYLRIFNNEKRFQAGVHLLKRLASPKRVGAFLSDVAEVILQSTMQEVWATYSEEHERKTNTLEIPPPGGGRLGGGLNDAETLPLTPPPQSSPSRGGSSLHTLPFAVLAMGKLGGREMTFGSDLDIVFLYADTDAGSDARQHIARISQRLVSALTLLTREGRLYEVDTRLRPGGADGPLAVSLSAFDAYFTNTAWTYEHMALTRARIVATNHPAFAADVEAAVRRHVLKQRNETALLKDVIDMRGRIATQFKTANPWALKHIRGGMVDLDFLSQYLVLRHGVSTPAIWHRSARSVFDAAQHAGLLDAETATALIAAKKFLSDLMSLLRLSAPGGAITDDAPEGLKRLLVKGMRADDFASLKATVLQHEENVTLIYQKILVENAL